ncbi:MAG TPA: hypothetical protein VFV93_05460 [Thermomicrobiales bacterium]|nr:hypothetical protein [Thermomicrobiales bacterium]
MIWQDFLITRDVPEQEIAAALATVFNVAQDRVLVVEDLMTYPGVLTDEIGIRCERQSATGDFVLSLTIYLLNKDFEQFVEAHDDIDLIGRMCRIWDCAALVSDDSLNPYSWLLVRGPDDVQPAHVDAESLDDDIWVLTAVPEAAGASPPMD